MAIFNMDISQSSVATHLMCGGIFNTDYCKFIAESASERNLKIDQHLAKIQSIVSFFRKLDSAHT